MLMNGKCYQIIGFSLKSIENMSNNEIEVFFLINIMLFCDKVNKKNWKKKVGNYFKLLIMSKDIHNCLLRAKYVLSLNCNEYLK